MSTWPAIIRQAIANALDETHVSIPGKIVSYDSEKQTCKCRSTIKIDPEIPELDDVPVLVLGGSRGYIHFDLDAGDTGLILFSDRDFSEWFVTGRDSEPKLLATHGLYAVFLPGLRTSTKKLAAPSEFPGVVIARTSAGATGPSGQTYVHLADKVTVTSGPYATTDSLCKSTQFIAWATSLEGIIDGLVAGSGQTLAQLRQGIATEMLESE